MVEASLKKCLDVLPGGHRRAQWSPGKPTSDCTAPTMTRPRPCPLACLLLVQRHLFGQGLERLGLVSANRKCGPAVKSVCGCFVGE